MANWNRKPLEQRILDLMQIRDAVQSGLRKLPDEDNIADATLAIARDDEWLRQAMFDLFDDWLDRRLDDIVQKARKITEGVRA